MLDKLNLQIINTPGCTALYYRYYYESVCLVINVIMSNLSSMTNIILLIKSRGNLILYAVLA